jgi:PAP2 superfamily
MNALKKIHTLLLVYLILLTFSMDSKAEQSFWAQAKDDSLSPFSTNARYILLTGGLLALSTLPLKKDDFSEDTAERHSLGSSSKFGDLMGQLVPNALYVGGMWAHSYFAENMDSKRRAIFMTKVTAYSSAMTTVLKYTIRERRPDHSSRNSFPSGHTTTAFAFASVIGIEHEWYYSVPAYALAGFVGYSRINDHQHYLADVIAGAAIGMSYGYGISKVSKQNPSSASFLVPTPDMKGMMLAFGKSY